MVDLVTLYDGGVFLGTPMGRCFEVERESGMYILFRLKQDVRYMLTLGESRAAARVGCAFYSAYTPPAAIWPLNDATRRGTWWRAGRRRARIAARTGSNSSPRAPPTRATMSMCRA